MHNAIEKSGLRRLSSAMLGCLLLCISIPISAIEPGWGKTTTKLKVHWIRLDAEPSTDEVIGAIPEGEHVQVLGVYTPGWYRISWNGNSTGIYVVAAKYVVMVESPIPSFSRAILDAPGERTHDRWFFVQCFDSCVAYDYISADEQANRVVAIGQSGQPQDFQLRFDFQETRFIAVPWNRITDQPVSLTNVVEPQFFFRYVRLIGTIVAHPLGGLLAFLFLLSLHILSSIWRNRYVGLWWAVPLTLLSLAFCGEVNSGSDELDRHAAVLRERLATHRAAAGHVLPLRSEELVPERSTLSYLRELEIFIALMHIPFFILLVRAHHGLHYLLVPHPIERRFRQGVASAQEVAAAMGQEVNVEHPPPEYKSHNWRRRIEELKKRIDAETDYLRSTVRNERARAEAEEKSDG